MEPGRWQDLTRDRSNSTPLTRSTEILMRFNTQGLQHLPEQLVQDSRNPGIEADFWERIQALVSLKEAGAQRPQISAKTWQSFRETERPYWQWMVS